MNILGTAFSSKRNGNIVYNDKTVDETETGTTVFSCYIAYPEGKRQEVESFVRSGNYLFVADNDTDAMFYTIVTTESNTLDRSIYLYAESIGLELLNHQLDASTEIPVIPQTVDYYVNPIIAGTDFEIGMIEVPRDEETNVIRRYILKFDSQTALERLNEIAATFEMEMYFTFKIERMAVTHKYLNVVNQRGYNTHKTLMIGREVSNIRTSTSVENLATALKPTGDVPEGSIGILGVKNEYGRQSYVWLKFLSTDEDENLYFSDSASGAFNICMSPMQWYPVESDKLSDYIVHRFNYDSFVAVYPQSTGIQEIVEDGDPAYTWVKFARDEYGTGMSDNYSSAMNYIGIASGKSEATKSTDPDDYRWYNINPSFGEYRYIPLNSSGVPTESGLHIRYSPYSDGKSMTTTPAANTKYVGYSFGRTTAPTSETAYEWVEFDTIGVGGKFVHSVGVNTGIPFNGKYIHYIWSSDPEGAEPTNECSGSYIGIRFDQDYPNPMSLNPASYIWSPVSGTDATALNLVGYIPAETDDDIYIENGIVKSREALKKWGRFTVTPNRTEHIVRPFSYSTVDYDELYKETVKELKKRREPEVTYEVELLYIPDGVSIGDTVYIVDPEGALYLSSRLLKIERSYCNNEITATLGDYKIETSGIDDRIQKLREQVNKQLENIKTYTWIVYADSSTGENMSTDSKDRKWMGIATNRLDPIPDLTNPYIYTWSKIKAKEELYTTYKYGISAGPNILPTEWSIEDVTPTEQKPYLWSKGLKKFDDGSTEEIAPHVIGVFGRGVASVVSWYGLSNNPAVEPTTYVKSPVPVITAENKYLWTYTVTTFTDGTSNESAHHIIGSYGEDGLTVVSDLLYYARTDTNAEPASSAWILCPPGNIPVITADHPYLWTKEDITYSDGSTVNVLAHIIGVYGEQGPKGDKGETGDPGAKGDKGDTGEQGPKGDTGDQGPKGDKGDTGDTGPKGDKGDPGDPGKDGEQGPKGDKGDKGDQGVSITSFKTQYYLSTSSETPTGGSWSDNPQPYALGHYYFIRTVTYFSNATSTTSDPVLDMALTSSNATAKEAQTTANGKNTVFYSASAPSVTGRSANDIWFDTDDGNTMYKFGNGAWIKQQFGNSAIAELSANKLTAGTIDASVITVSNIDAGQITSGTLSANYIYGGILQSNDGDAFYVNLDSGDVSIKAYSSNEYTDNLVNGAIGESVRTVFESERYNTLENNVNGLTSEMGSVTTIANDNTTSIKTLKGRIDATDSRLQLDYENMTKITDAQGTRISNLESHFNFSSYGLAVFGPEDSSMLGQFSSQALNFYSGTINEQTGEVTGTKEAWVDIIDGLGGRRLTLGDADNGINRWNLSVSDNGDLFNVSRRLYS